MGVAMSDEQRRTINIEITSKYEHRQWFFIFVIFSSMFVSYGVGIGQNISLSYYLFVAIEILVFVQKLKFIVLGLKALRELDDLIGA